MYLPVTLKPQSDVIVHTRECPELLSYVGYGNVE
jgi:hypothetical protein